MKICHDIEKAEAIGDHSQFWHNFATWVTCIDDGIATIVSAEQNVFAGSVLLKQLSYASVVVHYDSICKQDTTAVHSWCEKFANMHALSADQASLSRKAPLLST